MSLAAVALTATAACGGSSSGDSQSKASSKASASPSASASSSAPVSPSPSKLPTYSDASTGADRPTAATISQALLKASAGSSQAYTKAQADCVGKTLHDSTVSNIALKAIATLDQSFQASAKDNTALEKVRTQLQTCQTAK